MELPEQHVARLAQTASELIVRVRDFDPEENGRWLAKRLPDPADWFRLAFVLAAAAPDDRTWKQMTAWTRTTVLEPPSPSCGTAKAARRHLRRQEPLDVPCADALREYQRVQAANSRARARAAVAAAGMLPAA